MKRPLLLLLGFGLLAGSVVAQTTINSGRAFAYGANIGWINFRGDDANGVRVGEFFLSGFAYGANVGWINLGSGAPSNGFSYNNTSTTDCGVNHDGAGNLSGFAYGANIGWINFGWAAPNDPNRPTFNLTTGQFSGFAYGANVGWINLGAGYLATDRIAGADTDGDGIDDAWEMHWFGSLGVAGVGTDFDHDGVSDAAEAVADTDPTNPNDFLRIVSQSYAGGMTQVALQFTSSPARLYRLEHKADLTGTWEDSGLGTFSPDAGAMTTRDFSFPTGPHHFFRAVAVKPLAP